MDFQSAKSFRKITYVRGVEGYFDLWHLQHASTYIAFDGMVGKPFSQSVLWDGSNGNNVQPFWGWKKTLRGKPLGIGFEESKTSHMQLRVKSRIQAAARSRTRAVAMRGECVTTAPPRLVPSKTIEAASTVKFVPSCDTKPLVWMDCCSICASCVGAGGVGVANTIW